MKKCYICGKEIEDNKEVCTNCEPFRNYIESDKEIIEKQYKRKTIRNLSYLNNQLNLYTSIFFFIIVSIISCSIFFIYNLFNNNTISISIITMLSILFISIITMFIYQKYDLMKNNYKQVIQDYNKFVSYEKSLPKRIVYRYTHISYKTFISIIVEVIFYIAIYAFIFIQLFIK